MKIKLDNISVTDLLYYNHFNFLFENKNKFSTPETYLTFIKDKNNYVNYITNLFENIELENDEKYVLDILNRQYEDVIEESANLSSSGYALGYIVSYFPILADTYLSDILYKVVTPHISNQPFLTIPKFRLSGQVTNSNGTFEEYTFPNVRYLIRSGQEYIKILPLKPNNLFKLSNSYPNKINNKNSVVNKKFFFIDNVNFKVTDLLNVEHEINISLNVKPDNRSQIFIERSFEFNGVPIKFNIIGNINWDTGDVTFSASILTTDLQSFNISKIIIEYLETKVLFSATTGDMSRVKVKCEMHGLDINIAVNEDFEFDLTSEMLQDYTDIYKIDLVRTIGEAIKQQIFLNRDQDISTLLQQSEYNLKENKTYEVLNLNDYLTNNKITPRLLTDIFQSILPRISMIHKTIFYNNNSSPQFILTGIKSAAFLESLEDFLISMPIERYGILAFHSRKDLNNITVSPTKYTILTSPAIPDDKIYIIYRPDIENHFIKNPHLSHISKTDLLRTAVLINVIYKPLYSIEEITNGVKRNFIRSRTTLELLNPAGIGCIELKGLTGLLTNY